MFRSFRCWIGQDLQVIIMIHDWKQKCCLLVNNHTLRALVNHPNWKRTLTDVSPKGEVWCPQK